MMASATDPLTDPNWTNSDSGTGFGWVVFIDGSTTASYFVLASDAGSPPALVGSVVDLSNFDFTCNGTTDGVTTSFDTTANTYGMSLPSTCIGDPTTFSVAGFWIYDDNGTTITAEAPGGSGDPSPCCSVSSGDTTTTTTAPSTTTTTAPSTTTTTTAPSSATSFTFTSAQTGSSGQTAQFTVVGPWTLAWSFSDCAGGTAGKFAIAVNGSSSDLGPNESEVSGSGTDTYTDSGTFSLSVTSAACTWSATVTGSPTPTTPTTTTTSTTAIAVVTQAAVGASTGGSSGSDSGDSGGPVSTTPSSGLAFTGVGLGLFWALSAGVLLLLVGVLGRRRVAKPDRYREMSEFS